MNKIYFLQYAVIGLCTIMCSACSYLQHYQQQTQLSQIQSNISTSILDRVNEFDSRTPYHKTYEFEFNSTQSDSYALIFYFSESSFSNSIIKHRKQSDLHRDAIRIDESKNFLTTLNNHLPVAESIRWQIVANHITADEARDSYHVLQEYIRFKIREL